ncbi:GntR family transcriptional regulator [Streptosporangium sp. NPDC002544]|uniref:GntR family transcriptional regulator n=1 Tax=unclassified Streptosporangium TaxID=2632669 RepID=UPI0033229CA9
MVRQKGASTLASHFHEVVKGEIVLGKLPPGTHLKPAELASRHSTSTTVIREALVRLTQEKLVVARPNQGFFVPSLSLSGLEDLTRVRTHCDTFALRLAIERGDLAWETSVVTAYHVLTRTPRRTPEDPEHTTEAWSRAHRAFHLALVEACEVPMLMTIAETAFDSTELYRRWSAPSPAASTRSVAEEHELILEATLQRNTEKATALLAEHYERSLQVMLASGLIDGDQ